MNKGGTSGKRSQTFVVEIKSRENHSWQGSITWVEGHKKENFRSMLEMLNLMDSTMESGEEAGEDEKSL